MSTRRQTDWQTIRKRARSRFFAIDPDKRRWLIIGTVAGLSVLTLAVGWWILRSERWRYYTDGISIRQPSENAPLRHVLWEEPQPLRGRLNARADNHAPSISADGRTMVFAHGNAGQNADLYIARWNGEAWDEPRAIATLNTTFDELSPALSRDGQSLYFSSNRPGGFGGYDLWVARAQGDTWGEPVNLGPKLNSQSDETGPAPSPDGDRLYFSSNRPKHERSEMDKLLGKKSTTRDYDIFVAELKPAADAHRVDELNSDYDDGPVALTPRGEFVYFASNRPEGHGGTDIYRSRIFEDKFQPPQNLDEPVNSSANETDPAVWMEGYDLVFSSNRNSPDPQESYLYHSVSREVVARSDYSTLLAYLSVFKRLKWPVPLFTLALVALLYLMRHFMNEQWRVHASLLQRCLLGSALLHAGFAFLLSLWVISSAIYETKGLPLFEVAIDQNALAEERVSLDIREQITELFQPQLSVPSQEKVEHLPLSEVGPQKQGVTPDSTPTKMETAAAAVPTPASEGKQSDKLQPAEHAREIPKTQLASAPVQLESPQFVPAQAAKELAPAPSAVDVRPVKTGSQQQAPLVAAVDIPGDAPGSQSSSQRSALDGQLPVSESRPATTPAAPSQRPSAGPDSPNLPPQLAMEAGTPSKSQGAGPQLKPLQAGQGVATAAADKPLPASQPQAAPQQIAGNSAGKVQTSRSAFERDLPVAESKPTASLSGQQPAAKPAGTLEINTKLTMEAGTPSKSQGAGPQLKPLQAGQGVAIAAADKPLPAGQPQAVPQQIAGNSAGTEQISRSALGGNLPVTESRGTASLSTQQQPAAKPAGTLDINAKLTMEAGTPSKSQGTGPEIKPLPADQGLAQASSETPLSSNQPQKMLGTVGSGGIATNQPQRFALDGKLPVAESSARLSPPKSQPGKAAGSLQLSAKLTMEADKPSSSKGSGPEVKPLKADGPIATAATGDRPASQGQPQKLAQNLATGTGTDQTAQRSALDSGLPMQESQTATRLTAQGKSPTNVVGSLNFPAGVTMEAEQPAKAVSGTQEVEPTKSEFEVASAAASQLPLPRGEAQKIEQQITGGTPDVFRPQSGPVRPIESTPNLVEIHGPGQGTRLRIPALEVAASVTLSASNPAPYVLRDPKQRSGVLAALGGSVQTESAIARSLEWLTRHQETDGHWAIVKYGGLKGHDVGATALALLSYMGWGAKHTEPGPHQAAMVRGFDWLVKQVKYKGDMRRDSGSMYDHGMGTIALAEAYGLTKDPKLEKPLRKAISFILYAQNPDTGGWRYIPGAEGDTSVMGWQLMALKSAGLAGLDIPPHVMDKANIWLDRVSSGEHGGLYGYQDKTPLPAMCAEGMFCQQLLGRPPTDPRMQETAAYLKTALPSKEKEKINYYYWYYGSLALYQHQGPVWEQWNEQLRDILLKSQKIQGDDTGSWEPAGQWGRESGRVVATALATLSLEVYYRYLPLYGLTTASR